MKYLVVLLFWTVALHAVPLVQPDGHPSPPLKRLLELTSVETDGSLHDVVDKTQAAWLRPPEKERWELEEPADYLLHREEILRIVQELGFIDAITPSRCFYDEALWLGASLWEVCCRLNYFALLWRCGVRVDQFSILTGERELTMSERASCPGAKSEAEMMERVWMSAPLPRSLRACLEPSVKLICASKGEKVRANTADTYVWWLAQARDEPLCLLALSTQPYAQYQQLVAESILPSSFWIETVGPAAPQEVQVVVLLDVIARCLYLLDNRMVLKSPPDELPNWSPQSEVHSIPDRH
jgi:hypothetical protein